MGMYTEIYVNIDLACEIPSEDLDRIKAVANGEGHDKNPERWKMMGFSSSYLPDTHCAILREWGEWSKSLLIKGSIKNYNSEIEQFFKFISKYSETEFMGYMRYEEDESPTLIYRKELL